MRNERQVGVFLFGNILRRVLRGDGQGGDGRMSDNNLLDNLIEQYEAQCEALERMYEKDINELMNERDIWKQRALDAEAQIEKAVEKTENVNNRMRHV